MGFIVREAVVLYFVHSTGDEVEESRSSCNKAMRIICSSPEAATERKSGNRTGYASPLSEPLLRQRASLVSGRNHQLSAVQAWS